MIYFGTTDTELIFWNNPNDDGDDDDDDDDDDSDNIDNGTFACLNISSELKLTTHVPLGARTISNTNCNNIVIGKRRSQIWLQ